jgi:nitroreductase
MIAGSRERDASNAASHDALREAVAVARLAPSSHNSQPWAIATFESPDAVRALGTWLGVRPRADERWLVLALDAERALRALPALATEMRLSCGMFLQLLVAALADHGLAVRAVPCEGRVDVPPIAGYPPAWTPTVAVAISRGTPRLPNWSPALAADRRTNRAAYDTQPVTAAAQRELGGAEALFAGTPDRSAVSVMLIDDPGTVRAVGELVGRYGSVDFTNQAAWAETYRFIRFTARATASHADGFALTQLFGPLPPLVPQLVRAALSPPAMRVLRHLGVPAVMAKGLGRLVGTSPLLAWIAVDRDARWTEVVAGGVAIDLWMRATASGLAVHPVSALLQHDELRDRFQRVVGGTERAVFLARVGHPTATFPPTSRRSLEPGDQASGWVRL